MLHGKRKYVFWPCSIMYLAMKRYVFYMAMAQVQNISELHNRF